MQVNLQHRRKIAKIYDEILGQYLVSSESNNQIVQGSCFVNYPIFVNKRDEIYQQILKAGFHVGLSLYPNCHNHPKFKNISGMSRNVEILKNCVISIPTHPNITEAYAMKMATSILKIIEEKTITV